MKKYLGFLLAIMMVFSMSVALSACGADEETTAAPTQTLPLDEFDEKVPSKDIKDKVDDLEQTIKDGITNDEQKERFQSDARYIVANLPGASEVLGEYIEEEGKEPKTSYEDIDIEKLREQTDEYAETEETVAPTQEQSTEETESTETTVSDTTKPTAIELPRVKLK